ncbi:MAG: M48 family metalloprotease [Planctomycetaceae bacterium]
MMNRARFDELVEVIEKKFDGRPDALARHTNRWLLLGYAVVISLTMFLTGIGLALFVAGILIPGVGVVLIFAGVALIIAGIAHFWTVMITDISAPKGRLVNEDEAPELQQLVGLLRENLVVPPLDGIVVTNDFNASILQYAKFGIFGRSRQWLILGMPLMLAASTQELAAVLAHECGHLSRRHGDDSNHIYRMHRAWQHLFEKVRNNSANRVVRFSGKLLSGFINWYWPRFHARAFLLSRFNEFQADRIAADSTSPLHAASALWRIECTTHYLDNEFWKELWNLTETQAEPPQDLCDRLKTAFRNAPDSTNSARWCDISLKRVTSFEDTHPALCDRIKALGLRAEEFCQRGFPGAPEQSAVERLFGSDAESFEDSINNEWRSTVLSTWKERHRQINAVRKLSAARSSVAGISTSNPAELWAHARRVADVKGLEAAESAFQQVLVHQRDHAGATLALGQIHLLRGDALGEDLLSHVLGLKNREWSQPAGEILEQHFTATGRKSEAKEVRQQLDLLERQQTEAEKERREIRGSDTFIAHGLTTAQQSHVRTVLEKNSSCAIAWLVQKSLRYFPDERLFILAVDSVKTNGVSRSDLNNRMITSLMLQLELPGKVFIVTPTGEFRSAAKRIGQVPEWKVYERQ